MRLTLLADMLQDMPLWSNGGKWSIMAECCRVRLEVEIGPQMSNPATNFPGPMWTQTARPASSNNWDLNLMAVQRK